jgi:hypothetical protein
MKNYIASQIIETQRVMSGMLADGDLLVASGGSKIAGRDSHPQERRHLFMAHVELAWAGEKWLGEFEQVG